MQSNATAIDQKMQSWQTHLSSGQPVILEQGDAVYVVQNCDLTWCRKGATSQNGSLSDDIVNGVQNGEVDVVLVCQDTEPTVRKVLYSTPGILAITEPDPNAQWSQELAGQVANLSEEYKSEISRCRPLLYRANRPSIFLTPAEETSFKIQAVFMLDSSQNARLKGAFCDVDKSLRDAVDYARGRARVPDRSVWRKGSTLRGGWQTNDGFELITNQDSFARYSDYWGVALRTAVERRFCRLSERLLQIERCIAPAVASNRDAAARKRPNNKGCIRGTTTRDMPHSLFGLTEGFWCQMHRDKIVDGTTETIAWLPATTIGSTPYFFLIDDISVALELNGQDVRALLLDGALFHGTVPLSAAPDGSLEHNGVGAVISTRLNVTYDTPGRWK